MLDCSKISTWALGLNKFCVLRAHISRYNYSIILSSLLQSNRVSDSLSAVQDAVLQSPKIPDSKECRFLEQYLRSSDKYRRLALVVEKHAVALQTDVCWHGSNNGKLRHPLHRQWHTARRAPESTARCAMYLTDARASCVCWLEHARGACLRESE